MALFPGKLLAQHGLCIFGFPHAVGEHTDCITVDVSSVAFGRFGDGYATAMAALAIVAVIFSAIGSS